MIQINLWNKYLHMLMTIIVPIGPYLSAELFSYWMSAKLTYLVVGVSQLDSCAIATLLGSEVWNFVTICWCIIMINTWLSLWFDVWMNSTDLSLGNINFETFVLSRNQNCYRNKNSAYGNFVDPNNIGTQVLDTFWTMGQRSLEHWCPWDLLCWSYHEFYISIEPEYEIETGPSGKNDRHQVPSFLMTLYSVIVW